MRNNVLQYFVALPKRVEDDVERQQKEARGAVEGNVPVVGGPPLHHLTRHRRHQPAPAQLLLAEVVAHEIYVVFLDGNVDSRILQNLLGFFVELEVICEKQFRLLHVVTAIKHFYGELLQHPFDILELVLILLMMN